MDWGGTVHQYGVQISRNPNMHIGVSITFTLWTIPTSDAVLPLLNVRGEGPLWHANALMFFGDGKLITSAILIRMRVARARAFLRKLTVLAIALFSQTYIPYLLLGFLNRRAELLRSVFLCYAGSQRYAEHYSSTCQASSAAVQCRAAYCGCSPARAPSGDRSAGEDACEDSVRAIGVVALIGVLPPAWC